MIEFFLDRRSGTSPYMQLVNQVRQALLLDRMRVGDQLPTIKTVVGHLAINPNTVQKAYRELERQGLIESTPGVGTFVKQSLAGPAVSVHPELRQSLAEWLERARDANLDDETIVALFESAMQATVAEERV